MPLEKICSRRSSPPSRAAVRLRVGVPRLRTWREPTPAVRSAAANASFEKPGRREPLTASTRTSSSSRCHREAATAAAVPRGDRAHQGRVRRSEKAQRSRSDARRIGFRFVWAAFEHALAIEVPWMSKGAYCSASRTAPSVIWVKATQRMQNTTISVRHSRSGRSRWSIPNGPAPRRMPWSDGRDQA